MRWLGVFLILFLCCAVAQASLFPLLFPNHKLFYPQDINGGSYSFSYLSVGELDVNIIHAVDVNVVDYNVTGSLNATGDSNFVNIGVSQNSFLNEVIVGNKLRCSNCLTSNFKTTAMGYNTTASGSYGTAMGNGTKASGVSSTAMGYNTTASGDYGTAMGYVTRASGVSSTAMGEGANASGKHSTAIGYATVASAYASTAIGHSTVASQYASMAIGYYTKAFGFGSFAAGSGESEKGPFAIGRGSIALGFSDVNMVAGDAESVKGAIALGYNCSALKEASVCLGKNLTNYAANSVLVQDFNSLGKAYLKDVNVTRDLNVLGNLRVSGTTLGTDSNFTNIGVSGNAFLTNVKIAKDLNLSGSTYSTGRITAEGGFSGVSELVVDSGFDDASKWEGTNWTITGSSAVHGATPASSLTEKASAPPATFVIGANYAIVATITVNSGAGATITAGGKTIAYGTATGVISNVITPTATTALSINALGGPVTFTSVSIKRISDSSFGGATFDGNAVFNSNVSMQNLVLNALTINGLEGAVSKTHLLKITGGYGALGVAGNDINIQGSRGGDYYGAGSSSGSAGDILISTQRGGDGRRTFSGSIIQSIENAGQIGGESGFGGLQGSSAGNYIWYGGNGTNNPVFGLGGTGTSFSFFAGNAAASKSGPSNYDGVQGGGFYFKTGLKGAAGSGGVAKTDGDFNVEVGNGKFSVKGNGVFSGDLNVDQNSFISVPFASAWFDNASGTAISFAASNTWYGISLNSNPLTNGFYLSDGNLYNSFAGVYEITYRIDGSGQNNDYYVTTIKINDVNSGAMIDRKNVSAGGDITPMGKTGIVRLTADSKINFVVMDFEGTGAGAIYNYGLTIKRVGN